MIKHADTIATDPGTVVGAAASTLVRFALAATVLVVVAILALIGVCNLPAVAVVACARTS